MLKADIRIADDDIGCFARANHRPRRQSRLGSGIRASEDAENEAPIHEDDILKASPNSKAEARIPSTRKRPCGRHATAI
jgi:hypothetical protein